MLLTALLTILSISPARAPAQTPPTASPFMTRLEQSRTTLGVEADELSGPGARVIADAVAQARYVLIGEDHLSREIPHFTTSLCRLMAPAGLDALAIEIGPEAARVVDTNLRDPGRAGTIAAFMQAHPDAIAFQNGEDESDMAARCAGFAGPRLRIWGLDQEFFGAAGHLLERMVAAHPGPKSRTAIRVLAAMDHAATVRATASGSPGDLFVYTVTDQQMADAVAAIAADGGPRVKHLFDALADTRAIYLGQNADGFASNGRRARLLKRTLVEYLDAGPNHARILFKFGDVHMAKGVNGLGQRDLGNFVAERAEGEGTSSLHIAVYGAKGVHALYGGVGRQVRQAPFVLTDDPDFAWLKDALSLRDKAGDERSWMVIDLRRLRTRPPSDMGSQWRQFAQRYDLLLVAPVLTPSRLLGTR